MPRTALPGGIGFHPNDDKCCLTGVIVTGMVMRPIRLKQQLCYLVCFQEIDDLTEFYLKGRVAPSYSLRERGASSSSRAYGARP